MASKDNNNNNNNATKNKDSKFEILLPGKVLAMKNLITPEECQEYIQQSEKKGYKPATLQVGQQKNVQEVLAADVRNNESIVIDSPELADNIWKRVSKEIPEEILSYEDGTVAVQLNSSIRYYRYDKGQKFSRHYDGYEYGSVRYDLKKAAPQARFSLLIYLNDQYEGGQTKFYNSKGHEIVSVTPEAGKVLIYDQRLLHEGAAIQSEGRKYVLRTDIMYGEKGQSSNSSQQESGWGCSIS